MPTFKSEFTQLADELFEEFEDFIADALFERSDSSGRGAVALVTQTVPGIQTKANKKIFGERNIQVGDYSQVYKRKDFQWIPVLGRTTVTMKGVKQNIVDMKEDAADAAVILLVRRA